MTAHVGCSGWSYKEWRGRVYPEDLSPKGWFAHYASLFGTVEINNTFYRLPPAQTFIGWRQQAPPGFVYAVKLNRYGTHRRRLRVPETWLPGEIGRVLELGPNLGPLLVQLPPRWHADPVRLKEFCQCARQAEKQANTSSSAAKSRATQLRWVVEFRDASWLNDEIFGILAEHDFALCAHDLLPDHPWVRTTGWAYARFHGPQALTSKYNGDYGPDGLAKAAERLQQWSDEGADVYAYFNNDTGGAAVRDASWLSQRLS